MSYTFEEPDGTAGNPVPVDVHVRDGRPELKEGRITLERQGFTLANWPTRLRTQAFYDPKRVEREYYPEQIELIKRQTGAERVVILNNIVRNAGAADQRG